jgi:Uma2 family endonuclease
MEKRMVVEQRISEEAYQKFVLSGVEGSWELHDGRLVEKPAMTFRHGQIPMLLGHFLLSQLDRNAYTVVSELRVRRSSATVFVPDLMVVPTSYSEEIRDRPVLAIFSDPLPLVVEVWSHRRATTMSMPKCRSTSSEATSRSGAFIPTIGR